MKQHPRNECNPNRRSGAYYETFGLKEGFLLSLIKGDEEGGE
jgi:hypothetical protein